MSNYFILGSQALVYWLGDFVRTPKDTDVFYCDGTEKPKLKIENCEYFKIPKEIFNQFEIIDNYLALNDLYVLKLSHAEYNIHWLKTVNDIALMQKITGKLENQSERLQNLFNDLKVFWKSIHGFRKKPINLKKTEHDFFNDKITRLNNHDLLHDIVAYYDKPLFKNCLKENEEVLLDKQKFNNLSFEDKIKLCREEITVIALERHLTVSFYYALDNLKNLGKEEFRFSNAYCISYKHLTTRMSKGWFSDFLAENFSILKEADMTRYDKFLKYFEEARHYNEK